MKNHVPVLLDEIIEIFNPTEGQKFIDCTVGLGGHSKEILKKIGKTGKLLAIDQDLGSLDEAKKNLKEFKNVVYVNDNFKNLKNIAIENRFENVDGILLDLGIASWHFESSGRGFTFSKDEPLDMRLGNGNLTAKEVVNKYNEKKLADILYEYGDIRSSKKISKRIVEAREKMQIQTTGELVKIIEIKNPKVLAQIFQAIRIEVNNELKIIYKTLEDAVSLLRREGKIMVISFHSGEDRIVKNFFRENREILKSIMKKPIIPTVEEINKNSKSRSAKLRGGEKI